MPQTFLMVLADPTGMRWVLQGERMAFTETGAKMASLLTPGDRLLFYLARNGYKGFLGRRPRTGLLIGEAVVLTKVRAVKRPIHISGRRFSATCELFFETLTPLGSGVALKPMAERLELTAGRKNIGQAFRRSPVLLTAHDSELLRKDLSEVAIPFDDAVRNYLVGGTPTA